MKHLNSKTLRAFVAVAAVGLVASACEVDTAAVRLNVIDADEEAFFSNGDEPYIAVIKWRVTPGTPGSTQVSLLTEVSDELATRMDDGDSVAIPASAGAASPERSLHGRRCRTQAAPRQLPAPKSARMVQERGSSRRPRP